jgi:hypothetical protein
MPLFITTHVPQWLLVVILLMDFSASMSSLSATSEVEAA